MRARILTLALGCIVSAYSVDATAHGRVPRTTTLIEDPSDPNRLVLHTTRGLLLTTNGGTDWDWVCTFAMGYQIEENAAIAISDDGRIVAATSQGVTVADPSGCDWPVQSALPSGFYVDLGYLGTGVVAFLSKGDPDNPGQFINQLWHAADAQQWAQIGTDLPGELIGKAFAIAPTDRTRFYATGTGGTPVLARSADEGGTWETVPIVGAEDASLIDAAVPGPDLVVSPNDPNRVWIRIARNAGGQALILSEDGGDTFRSVFETPGEVLGLAFSPDASEVLLGIGDREQFGAENPAAPPDSLGIYRASATDLTFTRVYDEHIGCLSWTDQGIFACTSLLVEARIHGEITIPFDLGFRAAPDFTLGDTNALTPTFTFSEVRGELSCGSASTAGTLCPDFWPDYCIDIQKCENPDAGVPDAGTTPDAGTNNATGGGGGGCSIAPATSTMPWGALGALALLAARRRPTLRRRLRASSR